MTTLLVLLFCLPGRALIPLLILQQTGVLNSHKDRRRAQDNVPPCESSDPLDTTDDDCYTARWNMMVSYFPAHINLQQMDRKVIQGESEVEALWSAVLSDMDANEPMMFGTGKTLAAQKSATDGLLHVGNFLTRTIAFLNNVVDADSDWMANAIGNFSENSDSDSLALSQNIEKAISDLLNLTQIEATNVLVGSISQKENLMNSQASGALKADVAAIIAGERDVSNSVYAGQTQLQAFGNNFATLTGKLTDRLQTLSGTAGALNTSSATTLEAKLSVPVGADISASSDRVTADFKVEETSVQNRADNIFAAVTNATTFSSLHDDLENLVSGSNGDTMNTVTSWTDLMDAKAADWSSNITQTGSNISDAVSKQTLSSQTRSDSVTRVSQDFGTSIGTLSDSVSDESDALKSQSSDMGSDVQGEFADANQKLHALYRVTDQSSPLIQALLDTQSTSVNSLGTLQGNAGDRISALLGSLGSNGAALAGQVGSIQSNAQKATTAATNQVSAQSDTVNGGIEDTQRSGMANVLALSNSLDQLGPPIGVGAMRDSLGAAQSLVATQISQVGLSGIGDSTGGGLDQADAMAGMASQLAQAGQQSQSGLSSLASMVNSANTPVSELATSMANQDDRLATSIADTIRTVGKSSPPGDLRRDLNENVLHANRDLKARGQTGKADTVDKENMAAALTEQIANARANTQGIQGRIDSDQDTLDSAIGQKSVDFDQARDLMNTSDTQQVLLFNQSTAAMWDPALMQSFLSKAFQGRSTQMTAQLGQSSSEIAASISDSNKTSPQLGLLSDRYASLMANKYSANLLSGVAASVSNLGSDNELFSSNVDKMNKSFVADRGNVSEFLGDFLFNLSSSLAGIPSIFATTLVQQDNDFAISQMVLSDKIEQLQEELATTDNTTQRAALESDLTVLLQLQKTQDSIQGANDEFAANFFGNNSASLSGLAAIHDSMSDVVGAVNSLTTDIPRVASQAAIAQIGSQTAALLSGMAQLGNSTALTVSSAMGESGADAEFELGFSRNKRRLTQIGVANATNSVNGDLWAKTGQSLEDAAKLQGDVSTLWRINANRTLLDSVGAARHFAAGANAGLSATSAASQDKAVAQLAIMQNVLSSIVQVWVEFSHRQSRRMDVLSNSTTGKQLETDIVTRVASDTHDLQGANSQVSSLMSDAQANWANEQTETSEIDQTLNTLVNETLAFHDRKNSETQSLYSNIEEAQNLQETVANQTMATIQNLLLADQ